jgi:hypothetical protein
MRITQILRSLTLSASIVATSLLAACSATLVPVTTSTPDASATPAPTQIVSATLPVGADIVGVSLSKPTADSKAVFAACHIGDLDQVPIAKVTGVGELASMKDILHYVPLTGREPQIKESGPVWIVTVHYDMFQPAGNEVWVDPTCVITGEEVTWYATGPVKNTATGKVILPEAPAALPDRAVPPLSP